MKKVIVISSVSFIMFLLLGLETIVSHAQEKTVKLNMQASFPGTHWSVSLLTEWADEIEKGTDGTVKITRYDIGLMSPPAQVFDAVLRGIVDIGSNVLAHTPGRFPFMEIADVPLGCETATACGQFVNELYRKYKPKEFDKVKVLYFNTNTVYRLHANKPVRTLEDLKGLKVRTSGGTARIVKLLGATPVSMTMSESYDALSRGVVDANWASDEALKSWNLADVTKYSIWCDTISSVAIYVVSMNKGKWDSLTPKQQKVIEEATLKLKDRHIREWDIQETKIVEWAKKEKGVQFITLSAEEQRRWGEKVKPIGDDYVQKMKKLGLPGEEAMKFGVEYIKTHR